MQKTWALFVCDHRCHAVIDMTSTHHISLYGFLNAGQEFDLLTQEESERHTILNLVWKCVRVCANDYAFGRKHNKTKKK